MSNENKGVTSIQAFCLLAISFAAINQIQEDKAVSRVDVKKALEDSKESISRAIRYWPEQRRPIGVRVTKALLAKEQAVRDANTEIIAKALEQWGEVTYTVTKRNKASVLLFVCERAMVDLHGRLKTKLPRVLIGSIFEPLQRCSMLWKDGTMFSVHDESAAMVEKLQEIIGF